jgi:hypothetical protein
LFNGIVVDVHMLFICLLASSAEKIAYSNATIIFVHLQNCGPAFFENPSFIIRDSLFQLATINKTWLQNS